MTLDEFVNRPLVYEGRADELDSWSERSFKQQMQDIYGEAHRFIKFHREGSDRLSDQWDVLDAFCMMTYLDPSTTCGERETLKLAEWELYDYVFGDNVFRNNDESIMRWFNQWIYDVNYAVLAEG